MTTWTAITSGVAMTHALAAELAGRLRPGDLLTLRGTLGAGKTVFVSGLAAALGSTDEVLSPTFTLENRYAPRAGSAITEILHIDLYRFEGGVDAEFLGSIDEARSSGAVVLVEWGERLEGSLDVTLDLEFVLMPGRNATESRRLTLIAPDGPWGPGEGLQAAWDTVAAR